jgi:GAF domain-containing protein
MNLSFFKSRTVQGIEDLLKTDTMQSLRLRILNNLLIVASVGALIVYFLEAIRSFDQIPAPIIVVFTLLVLWVLVITIFRQLPFHLRAFSLIIAIYFLGVSSFIQGGLTTDGAVLLITYVFAASLLVGPWGSMVSATSSLLTVIVIGILMSNHVLIPFKVFASDDGTAWFNRGAVIILLTSSIGLSISTILRGLQDNLKKATNLANELEKGQTELREHSENLEKRSLQIRTAAEISRSISGVLTREKLLQDTVELILKSFNLYYVGLFLVDETEHFAVLQAGTGEAGTAMLAAHHQLPIAESSMIGWTIINRKARIALDVGKDAIRFANPYLPDTHSELALPLISGDRALGAITVQSSQVQAFDQDDINILENISGSLATSLENSRLFEQTQTALEELRVAQRSYVTRAWSDIGREQNEFEYTASANTYSSQDNTSSIDVPLTLREQIIGQLHLEGDQDWTPEDKNLIEAVASQAALAMENARLLEESQQSALRERIVTEITGKVWTAPNTDFILQTAIKEIARVMHADDAIIEINPD